MHRALCRLLASLALLALVAAAACGGDDGDADAVTDQEDVDRAVLMLSDLPEGWANDESDDDDSDDDLDLPAECDDLEGVVNRDEFEGQTAQAKSASFVRGQLGIDPVQVTLDAEVAAGEDADAVADVFEQFRDERLLNCLDDAFTAELQEQSSAQGLQGVEIGAVSVTRPEPPDLGDEAISARIETTLRVQGVELPFTADIVAVRQGRYAVSLSALTIGPFPGEQTDAVAALESMLDRLPS